MWTLTIWRWVDKLDNFDVNSINDDAPEGSILEVDLDYPKELYKIHKDLPFCAEHKVPPGSKLPIFMTILYPKNISLSLTESEAGTSKWFEIG